MSGFLVRGWHCWVVDYTPRTVPGIARLGETLDDVDPSQRFDLIVCSHVLEHVADPVGTIKKLRCFLAERGVLYVEVPMEIWRRPPIHEEPVTHVNFFTLESLRFGLENAGLCGSCRLGTDLYYGNRRPRVLRAWVWPSRNPRPARPHWAAAAKTRRLLRPGLYARLRFAVLDPRTAAQRILRRVLGGSEKRGVE